ncbi:hypothetical protein PHYPSEUDO_011439 [Phytophthora pseudosyringae]|uniref:RxLR effector protein n=1 Tax=Phytophthora pseudosyringae TaxID=221518 RepID=A0A8T1W6S2_9STRA|nr:hypothetical protein PHYPSEUDO_011439 [Phytophthora pseudosyringae]
MRLGQLVVVVAMMALLASIDCFAAATKNEIATAAADNARKLLSFGDVDTESKTTKEERVSAGAKAAAEGGRTGAGETVVSTGTNGGTVTVTVYNNNGLWQRTKKWWQKKLSSEERATSGGITSGEGGRAGAGGTVVSNDNGNGGTVTVTVYNNNGLFQRIVRWWKKIWGIEVASTTSTPASTRRLRQY